MKDEAVPIAFQKDSKANSSDAEMKASPITRRFGITVRRLRRGLGISQEDLAVRAGLHRTYIADVERGSRNVTLRTMERLAHGLEVSLPELLKQTGEPASQSEPPAGQPAKTNVDKPSPKL